MKIHAKRALIHGKWQENRVVEICGERIASVGCGTSGDISVEFLTPGLFDKHHHGGVGFDCAAPEKEACAVWLKHLLSHGITDVLFTIATGPVEVTRKAVAFAAEVMDRQANGELPGACVRGVHLEGPFINPKRRGAMAGEYVLAPTEGNFQALVGEHEKIIRAITVAPEMPGACELAERLASRGIHVQAGHTDADYAGMKRAAEHGFSGITHMFNAMADIEHRKPGPAAFGMLDDRICVEAICDFVHLAEPVVRLIFKAKGAAGIAMVSDCGMVSGMPEGEYTQNNHYILVKDNRCYSASGGISGSYVFLDSGVRCVAGAGIPMEDAFTAASATPARCLGFSKTLGDLVPGMAASLAGWDSGLNCTWACAGTDAFSKA